MATFSDRRVQAAVVQDVVGDYAQFFADLQRELSEVGIDVAACPLSHLGYKAATMGEYAQVRDRLIEVSGSYLENEHNGRPIAKIILREELVLAEDFVVSMIEVMPPKEPPSALRGLEHCGFVLGDDLEVFIEEHGDVLTGRQDQGPFCQPAYVSFASGRRAKFYSHSLESVVKLEGHSFVVRQDG
jgi:predicted metalloenzyme YecM